MMMMPASSIGRATSFFTFDSLSHEKKGEEEKRGERNKKVDNRENQENIHTQIH